MTVPRAPRRRRTRGIVPPPRRAKTDSPGPLRNSDRGVPPRRRSWGVHSCVHRLHGGLRDAHHARGAAQSHALAPAAELPAGHAPPPQSPRARRRRRRGCTPCRGTRPRWRERRTPRRRRRIRPRATAARRRWVGSGVSPRTRGAAQAPPWRGPAMGGRMSPLAVEGTALVHEGDGAERRRDGFRVLVHAAERLVDRGGGGWGLERRGRGRGASSDSTRFRWGGFELDASANASANMEPNEESGAGPARQSAESSPSSSIDPSSRAPRPPRRRAGP